MRTHKAVLLFRRTEFPLTHDIHDIEELPEIAEQRGLSLPETVREAGALTPYAVETRYPGSWIDIADSDADEAVQTAEQVVTRARLVVEEGQEEEG